MKPWQLLASAKTPSGDVLTLHRRDTELVIRANGLDLMSNRMHDSEDALAELACSHVSDMTRPRVLIGGLGMGFTLASALRVLPARASVTVAELVPELVEWNRGVLAELASRPLEDARVKIELGDVGKIIGDARQRYDAILLDVDNGPRALTDPRNRNLYGLKGLREAARALTERGVYALWSAAADPRFTRRLESVGFDVACKAVFARKGSTKKHYVWLARRSLASER